MFLIVNLKASSEPNPEVPAEEEPSEKEQSKEKKKQARSVDPKQVSVS